MAAQERITTKDLQQLLGELETGLHALRELAREFDGTLSIVVEHMAETMIDKIDRAEVRREVRRG